MRYAFRVCLVLLTLILLSVGGISAPAQTEDEAKRLLYVASPGIRNYLQYGGHGVLVFDIDDGHRFLRRISLEGYGTDENGKVLNIKGICASADTGRLYVSTLRHLICLDLASDEVLWQREFEFGCDRMSIAPDGSVIYLPSLEKHCWYVANADGEELARISPDSSAHNTVYGRDGKHVYLAGLRSPLLTVAKTSTHTAARTVGPFSNSIRPFTVNGRQTLAFVNVNGLLGFEIGDIQSGKMLHRVEVEGFEMGPVARHGCPSHGIGLTPDEREIWVADGHNSHVHVFDVTSLPPRLTHSLSLREQPGWVTFTIRGDLAYPSTGEVFDARTKRKLATLSDEEGREVHSEKMLEIDFHNGRPVRTGDQFGVGRVVQ